ncbi:hypothetical protein R5R35_004096 [Gryllus longicercus]|uniref:Uncharacterized protein n=1 Tax=Gryllus longicercus TaxID=2509291 RepID=A0AAN9VNC0_9ORTH
MDGGIVALLGEVVQIDSLCLRASSTSSSVPEDGKAKEGEDGGISSIPVCIPNSRQTQELDHSTMLESNPRPSNCLDPPLQGL